MHLMAEEALKDPTKPAAKEAPKKSVEEEVLELNAIIISADRKVVIINRQVLQEGDWYADAKVLTIKPDQVELQGPKGKITLELLQESNTLNKLGSVDDRAVFTDVKIKKENDKENHENQ